MSKSSVIMDATSSHRPRELNQGSTSTIGTVFRVDDSLPVYLDFPTSGGSGGLSSRRASKTFTARAWGRVTGGGVTNFTISILLVTQTAEPILHVTTAPVAVSSESDNWYAEILLVWDSTSNKLNSLARTMVGNTWDTPTAGTQVLDVGLDSGIGIALAIAGTFSAGFTGNMAFLDGFQLEEN